MKIVCIGDSLTLGYGVSKDSSWFELLNLQFNGKLINKGINGDTTAEILSRSYKDIINIKPNYVIIMAGTNDLLLNRSLKNIKENLSLLIQEVLNQNIVPIIAIPIDINVAMAEKFWSSKIYHIDFNKKLGNLKDWIINFCTIKNLNYIDFYSIFKYYQKNCSPDELYIDGIHPTILGHKILYNEAYKVLNNLHLKV